MLQALLGDDPSLAALKTLLIARTEGNPFFLEESVRTLVETGVLLGEPGAYQLTQALPTIQVPATVQAVLAARMDRLPAEEKRLLQTAAVIGTEVPLPLLQAIAELPEAALHRGLAHLQAAEFLYETRLFPDLVYTFKHALTHEVAYGSLLQERRRALHARHRRGLEGLAGDQVAEQVELLAYHTLRGEVWDKALAYCRQAGEKALARSAHREAVGCFEQALSALPHLPETARHARAGHRSPARPAQCAPAVSATLGRILAYLREAEALAAALDDPRRLGQVSLFLSAHFRLMGAHDQAIAAAQRALALATAGGEVVLQALANHYLGGAYHAQGDYRRAIDCFAQTVATLRRGAAPRALRASLPARRDLPCLARLVPCRAGHVRRGPCPWGRRAADCRGGGSPRKPHVRLLGDRSAGPPPRRPAQGTPPARTGGGPLSGRGPSLYFPWVAAALGAAYTLGGRVADAVPLLTQAMEQTIAMETVGFQALCRLALGEAQLLAGRLEEAQALAERALALARAAPGTGPPGLCPAPPRRDRGAARASGEQQAEAHYRQALALAEELGMRPLVAHCHHGLGKLYATIGRHAGAGPLLEIVGAPCEAACRQHGDDASGCPKQMAALSCEELKYGQDSEAEKPLPRREGN